MERLGASLKTCPALRAISFSKNNLGIDDFEETDSEFEDDHFQEEEKGTQKKSMCPMDQKCMTDAIVDICKHHDFMERLCLAHCYFHDRGMKIIAESLPNARIRYLNFSWCRLTSGAVPDLCRFIKYNRVLEKVLIQHNELGDSKSMKQISIAISDHPAIKYLDISANNIGSENFKLLLKLQELNKIKLENLQVRKNYIKGEQILGVFKSEKLILNSNLRVLNLQDNRLNTENATEICEHYLKRNIYIEQIVLKGNKALHPSTQESIDHECRKNLLV